jgi:hypothetical protein
MGLLARKIVQSPAERAGDGGILSLAPIDNWKTGVKNSASKCCERN